MTDDMNLQSAAIAQFITAIKSKKIAPPKEIIGDGKRHYFSSNEQRHNNAGWYIYYNDAIPHGSFGDYRTNLYVKSWSADLGRPLTEEETAALEQSRTEHRVQRKKDQKQLNAEARARALAIMATTEPADDAHDYLVKKDVKAHNIRAWNNPIVTIKHNDKTDKDYLELKSPDGKVKTSFGVDLDGTTAEAVSQDWQTVLLIPMLNGQGEIQSIQFISKSGAKKFLFGGKMQGNFFPIGKLRDTDTIMIAEGYATASTVYEITGVPTVVAYNAGNLGAVAKEIRTLYPDAKIIFCADDDYKTKDNPGLTKADEAAADVGGYVVPPDFGKNRPVGATDFNDMAAHLGKDAVTSFFTFSFSERIRKMPKDIKDTKQAARYSEQELSFSNPNAPAAAFMPQGKIIAGTITKCGVAPYKHDAKNDPRFFIDIKAGEVTRTLWGNDLETALKDSGLRTGDRVAAFDAGAKVVQVPFKMLDKQGNVVQEGTKPVVKSAWQILPFEETIVERLDDAAQRLAPTPTGAEPYSAPHIKTYFDPEKFLQINDIWKDVPRKAASHANTGYLITLANRLKVTITTNKITVEKSLLHRPADEVYIAACEQARQLWDGQMTVTGDSKHRIKALAYATVYGVEITNFTPTTKEQAEADKLIEKITNAMEPSFGRPQAVRKPQGQKPNP